jgi:hypothetical protein
MNAPNDNTAPKGLRGWWASPRRHGMQRTIVPWEFLVLGALNLGGGYWYITIARSASART